MVLGYKVEISLKVVYSSLIIGYLGGWCILSLTMQAFMVHDVVSWLTRSRRCYCSVDISLRSPLSSTTFTICCVLLSAGTNKVRTGGFYIGDNVSACASACAPCEYNNMSENVYITSQLFKDVSHNVMLTLLQCFWPLKLCIGLTMVCIQ